MATPFRERLDRVSTVGAISTADLAEWFGLPYATIRSWRSGSEPQAARRPQIEQRLSWLEDAVDTDPRLPVPLLVRSEERRQYLIAIRGAYERGERVGGQS